MNSELLQTPCMILSLDGGGAKGFYTLGVLRELEAILTRPIHEHFQLIYGTSTGSIIAALLGLGYSVNEIHELYKKHVPDIMNATGKSAKSKSLQELGRTVFEDKKFEDFLTGVGIVSVKWLDETPMIFKSSSRQAHGRKSTFVPGFGCRIADAVQASSSAYPFFEKKAIVTDQGDEIELIDGGYCANNPTLYAIADAINGLEVMPSNCRVLSIGTGKFPERKPKLLVKIWKRLSLPLQLLSKTMSINTESMEQLRKVLFVDVPSIRVEDMFDNPELATDMFETDLTKLNLLRQKGALSFASREKEIRELLEV